MKVTKTSLPGVMIFEPKVHGDARGHFVELWAADRYSDGGAALPFVQDNLSVSGRGTLRGLHLQHPHAQGKLVTALQGEVFDVAVDVRVGSPHFGKWFGTTLSSENYRQLYVPPGFAHGFCVVSERATFAYKCTDTYHPETELSVLWNDPEIGIEWPVAEPTLSAKDREALPLSQIAAERLPRFEGQ